MAQQSSETLVGAVVLAVAIGFLGYAVSRAGAGESTRGGYELIARFDRVNGVSVGSDVRLSGVKIGAVSRIGLDPATYLARVTLNLDPKIKVPEDSVAKITADGLLGGAYVGIEPGGSPDLLKSGGEIAQTQSPVDLLTLFSSAASSQSSSSAPKPAGEDTNQGGPP